MPRFVSPLAMICVSSLVLIAWQTSVQAVEPLLTIAAVQEQQFVAIQLHDDRQIADDTAYELVDVDAPDLHCPVQIVPSLSEDGTVGKAKCVLASIPPRKGATGQRRFRLQPSSSPPQSPARMRLIEDSDVSVRVLDDNQPVLVYNHGAIVNADVPETDARRKRACYVHPLWGVNGEILTDDFPADHYHHHGIFWTWPHIDIDGTHYDLWISKDIEQRFVRWLHRQEGAVGAVIGVENGWFVGDRQVMTERIWLRAFRGTGAERAIDIEMVFLPVDRPIQLKGSPGKSYGGLTVRFDVWPRRDAIVRTPEHVTRHVGSGLASSEDLTETHLPWADLATKFPGAPQRSGAAVFVPPSHPDYPPTWLTRCYGPLCVGWPGVRPRTFQPGEPIHLAYRIWIHGTELEEPQLAQVYAAYVAGLQTESGD